MWECCIVETAAPGRNRQWNATHGPRKHVLDASKEIRDRREMRKGSYLVMSFLSRKQASCSSGWSRIVQSSSRSGRPAFSRAV